MTEPLVTNPLVDHVGIIVADLDRAIASWSRVTGYSFTPVMNYRTDAYEDASDPAPHHHDAKIAFSIEGPPFIELMEFTGDGTHAAAQGEGFHHLGFRVIDAAQRREDLSAMGIADDGASLGLDGRPILWFTDRAAVNGVRLEYVGSEQQPVFDAEGHQVVYEGPAPE